MPSQIVTSREYFMEEWDMVLVLQRYILFLERRDGNIKAKGE